MPFVWSRPGIDQQHLLRFFEYPVDSYSIYRSKLISRKRGKCDERVHTGTPIPNRSEGVRHVLYFEMEQLRHGCTIGHFAPHSEKPGFFNGLLRARCAVFHQNKTSHKALHLAAFRIKHSIQGIGPSGKCGQRLKINANSRKGRPGYLHMGAG